MYNSQYYTCEQIDERLLQGYLDDYNSQTGQNLTKEQFLTALNNTISVASNVPTELDNLGKDVNLLTDILAISVDKDSLVTPATYQKGWIYKVDFGNGTVVNSSDYVKGYKYYIAKVNGAPGDSLEDSSKFDDSFSSVEILNKLVGYLKTDSNNVHAQIGYYECSTAGATAAKTIAAVGYTLFVGGSIKVKFANKNTVNDVTLNINSQGAKALYYQGERASATNSWDANEVVEIYYDGTSYYANNVKGDSGSGVYDVSVEHPTAGPNGDGKFTLDYILNPSNVNDLIPVNKRRPGMTIQFVSTSDNKYVQYRLMADEWSIDTSDWALCSEDVLIENPEFIHVETDKDGRILWGIKVDGSIHWGAGIPPQVIDYVTEKIEELSLDEYEDIVAFLGNLITGDKTLQELLNEKVDKVEGESLIDSEYAEGVSYTENPEYLSVEIDNTEKIMSARKPDGTKKEFVGIETPTVKSEEIEGLSEEGRYGLFSDLNTVEAAKGLHESFGSYQSELLANPVTGNESNMFVDYDVLSAPIKKESCNNTFVVINHDDGNLSDLMGSRKIYNKYGYKGSFCLLFRPFNQGLDRAKEQIKNGRKLIKEGFEVGLHGIIDASYWRVNSLFDIRPDGSNTFAPTLSEIATVDVNNKNIFGETVTPNTLVSAIYYNGGLQSSPLFSKKVVELTQSELNEVNGFYTFIGDKYTLTAIDDLAIDNILKAESAETVTKTRLQWVEYYYNGLVDNTLGFSSSAASIADRYADDYSVPSGSSPSDYYPDAAHLLNGKMVYWEDTGNPHFAEAILSTDANFNEDSYQLVGKVKRGLFKDCYSYCNFEVERRCIEVSRAFFKKYYNINNFTDCHIHGIAYTRKFYIDNDEVQCFDRTFKVPVINGKIYHSLDNASLSDEEVMRSCGFKLRSVGVYVNRKCLEYDMGGYYGQGDITDDMEQTYSTLVGMGFADYLSTFGTSTDGRDEITMSQFNTFLNGIDNWTKFFFENSGQSVTRNGITMNVYNHIRYALSGIVSCIGTGKICGITVDTIRDTPSMMLAMELLLRFCKANNIDVISLKRGEEAVLSKNRIVSGNLFPNSGFNQILLSYFGGTSTSNRAYVPDGWNINFGNPAFDVHEEEIDGVTKRVLNVSGQTMIRTRIYGLPSGDYQLSFDAKGKTSSVEVKIVRNGDVISTSPNIDSLYVNNANSWQNKTININIPTFYRKLQDTPISQYCNGYENNVCCIEFRVNISDVADSNITLANLNLIKL